MTCTFGSASEPSTTAAVEFVEGHADAAPIEGPASRRHRAHGNDAPGAPISALATGRPRRRTTELSPRRTAADVWRLQILLGARLSDRSGPEGRLAVAPAPRARRDALQAQI